VYTGPVSESGSLFAHGYCPLAGALAAEDAAAVMSEAAALAGGARHANGAYYRVNGDGSISSPRSLSTVAAGPVLQAIHRSEVRLALLERVAGRPLMPTRGSYIYYEPGDYIGLHRDASACAVTLITSVAGVLDPLVVHPSLVGVPPEELVAISRAHSAMPPGGIRVAVPGGGRFLMLLGSTVPHHRPAALDFCTIATLCYA
jgi:hypothetical protein